jgi:hypothetical protein
MSVAANIARKSDEEAMALEGSLTDDAMKIRFSADEAASLRRY